MSNGTSDPRVWILKGAKAGDFAQMHALATALRWPFEIRNLVFRQWELILHAAPWPTLLAVDSAASDPLVRPWPDLVLTAGRRNELPALWIRRQAERDDARRCVRVVHVGRPWSAPERFDLVVANRQYALEAGPRVVVNDLPLHVVEAERIEVARTHWSARFAAYAAPRVAVFLGGSSGPLVLTPTHAAALGRRLDRFVREAGGSVFVTDSPRTPGGVVDALVGALRVPAFVHRFGGGGENPYVGILACADAFVVTADSVSMVAEAVATGQPVYVYDYRPEGAWWRDPTAWRWRPVVHRLSHAIGPPRMRRDVHGLHAALVASGRARWFTDDARLFAPVRVRSDELERTAARVRALFGR